jgi:hypothetical protein
MVIRLRGLEEAHALGGIDVAFGRVDRRADLPKMDPL